MHRLSAMTAVWILVVALLSSGVAFAQEDEDGDDDDAPAEAVSYGDVELIESLHTYGLLDDWIAASPVSPQASLLLVTGNSGYHAQRRTFLNSVEAWADRTRRVRNELARVDAAQANSDRLRSIATQVRDALVLDDRLRFDSDTLAEIEDALGQLSGLEMAEPVAGEGQDPLTRAELQLIDLRELSDAELRALNGAEPAFAITGTAAFVGFERLIIGLNDVDQLIKRARDSLRPALEESERLASSAVAQIPRLHASRMLGSSDVGGLSIVTVDAYMRGAARSGCSVDWALLAGIGQVESNHGRLGGGSVSASGQVSTTIFGPLLDGGETERELAKDQQAMVTEAGEAIQRVAQAALGNSWWDSLREFAYGSAFGYADIENAVDALDVSDESAEDAEPGDQGNGFAVVVDSDGGRLDGNEEWDRAIGPMQFIPETWSKWATDGNGDGVSDPHNLYDAAAAAGRFLCHLSSTRGASPSTFLLGYNASTSYVRRVMSTAETLRATPLPDV